MSSQNSIPVLRRSKVTLTADSVVNTEERPAAPRIVRSNRERENDDELDSTASPLWRDPRDREQSVYKVSRPSETTIPLIVPEGATVMVVNASHEMARELTVELSQAMPGCTVLFAPTLSTALWMLKRRSIDIILSSSILPDGPLARLHEVLEMMSPPPELVVLSELGTTRSEMSSHPGYRFVELRRFGQTPSQGEPPLERISSLGADIRNDLNNPLQEIVAMAFVAQASQGLSPVADQALAAIERAAGNMASVVAGLEDKIRLIVEKSAA